MKKIIALTLVIACIFSVIAINSSATEIEDSISCLQGGVVNITVSLPRDYDNIKSASIEFNYDDEVFNFESYKWIPSLTLKNYNPATKQGVSARASVGTWSGDLFKLDLVVSADAAYGNYPVSGMIKLMTGSNEFIMVDFVYTVSVVEYIEIDDETTPEMFAEAVENINSNDPNQDTYVAIAEALQKYSALTTAEKSVVADDYNDLINIIENYNSASVEINEQSKTATTVAFAGISGVFSCLSLLIDTLRQMIWN